MNVSLVDVNDETHEIRVDSIFYIAETNQHVNVGFICYNDDGVAQRKIISAKNCSLLDVVDLIHTYRHLEDTYRIMQEMATSTYSPVGNPYTPVGNPYAPVGNSATTLMSSCDDADKSITQTMHDEYEAAIWEAREC